MLKSPEKIVANLRIIERKEYKEHGLKDKAAERERKREVKQLLFENKLVPPEKLVLIVIREKAYL